MGSPKQLSLYAVPRIPLIKPGDDIAKITSKSLFDVNIRPKDDDVFVIAQKIVSKAQNRYVDLATVVPSQHAKSLAAKVDKDPRLVELILSESVRVVRKNRGILIVEHREGYIMANAGIDRSNVDTANGKELVLLLPRDSNATAKELHSKFVEQFGRRLGVIISDSFGRPWRRGTVGVALGVAGIPALNDLRGKKDLSGYPLKVTETGFADEIASAASLLMGQADEGNPVVLVSGLLARNFSNSKGSLIRPAAEDLFR
mgnify:FL=1